jgi:hypothetical protein
MLTGTKERISEVGKSMADTDRKLKSSEKFSAAMAPSMAQFDENLREHLLVALYARAEQGRWLEEIRSQEKDQVPALRKNRKRAGQMRRRVEKAIESVQKAQTKDGFEVTANCYLFQAAALLRQAVADLRISEDSFATAVHPEFRTKIEQMTKARSPRADRWSLRILVTQKGSHLPLAEIDRIISAALVAAYGGGNTGEQVKTARIRLGKAGLLGSDRAK